MGSQRSDMTEHAHAMPHQRCLCPNSQNLRICYQYLSQGYYNKLPPPGNLLSHSPEARSITPRYQQGVCSWRLRGRICSMPPSQLPGIADDTVLGCPWLVDTSVSAFVSMQSSPCMSSQSLCFHMVFCSACLCPNSPCHIKTTVIGLGYTLIQHDLILTCKVAISK